MATKEVIVVKRDLLASARHDAEVFRRAMLERGTFVVNVLSSPGAGKTSLISELARHLNMAVLVGDIATDRDAQRLSEQTTAVQLTTGGACHLEYPLVEQGWQALGEPNVDFLFIENIGNLVCPASHDLGEHLRVVLLSSTEGDDKPAKYPKAFRTSHVLVISKTDLLPYVPFQVEAAAADARSVRPELAVFPVSIRPPTGVVPLAEFLSFSRTECLAGKSLGLSR